MNVLTPLNKAYHVVAQRLMTIKTHLLAIESQSQLTPPSPTPSTIEYSLDFLMFLDHHLKYPQADNSVKYDNGNTLGYCGATYKPKIYQTSGVFTPDILYGYKTIKNPGGYHRHVSIN
jgi:hypothetical protein